MTETETERGEVTIDGLTRDWKIIQRKHGHRHSTDDLLTAWYAAEHVATRTALLDLGSGIGSVGMLLLWRSPGAKLTAIEAQPLSFGLLQDNIALNRLGERIEAIHGDLRTVRFADRSFDAVTASPPYFDITAGIVSADSQRAHARFELRGDIRDYCEAARAALRTDGRFVFCFPSNQRTRAEQACGANRFAIERTRDVVPRAGIAPLFSLWVCRRSEDDGPPLVRDLDYIVRDHDGKQTAEHARTRASFGLTVPPETTL